MLEPCRLNLGLQANSQQTGMLPDEDATLAAERQVARLGGCQIRTRRPVLLHGGRAGLCREGKRCVCAFTRAQPPAQSPPTPLPDAPRPASSPRASLLKSPPTHNLLGRMQSPAAVPASSPRASLLKSPPTHNPLGRMQSPAAVPASSPRASLLCQGRPPLLQQDRGPRHQGRSATAVALSSGSSLPPSP